MDAITSTGFPSPAEDFQEKSLLLDELLIQNKISTYFMEIDSSQWQEIGIFSSDIIVIDRSLQPKAGDRIIVICEGEFCLKFFKPRMKGDYSNFTSSDFYQFWGVITSIIHRIR